MGGFGQWVFGVGIAILALIVPFMLGKNIAGMFAGLMMKAFGAGFGYTKNRAKESWPETKGKLQQMRGVGGMMNWSEKGRARALATAQAQEDRLKEQISDQDTEIKWSQQALGDAGFKDPRESQVNAISGSLDSGMSVEDLAQRGNLSGERKYKQLIDGTVLDHEGHLVTGKKLRNYYQGVRGLRTIQNRNDYTDSQKEKALEILEENGHPVDIVEAHSRMPEVSPPAMTPSGRAQQQEAITKNQRDVQIQQKLIRGDALYPNEKDHLKTTQKVGVHKRALQGEEGRITGELHHFIGGSINRTNTRSVITNLKNPARPIADIASSVNSYNPTLRANLASRGDNLNDKLQEYRNRLSHLQSGESTLDSL